MYGMDTMRQLDKEMYVCDGCFSMQPTCVIYLHSILNPAIEPRPKNHVSKNSQVLLGFHCPSYIENVFTCSMCKSCEIPTFAIKEMPHTC